MLDHPLTVLTPFKVIQSQNNLQTNIWDKLSNLLKGKPFSFPCCMFNPSLRDNMSVIVSCIGIAKVKCDEEVYHGNENNKIWYILTVYLKIMR